MENRKLLRWHELDLEENKSLVGWMHQMMFISVLLMGASKFSSQINKIFHSLNRDLKLIFFSFSSLNWRRARKTLTIVELRRSARKPWRQLNSLFYTALAKTLTFASLPTQLQIQPLPQSTPEKTNPTVTSTKAASGVYQANRNFLFYEQLTDQLTFLN